MEIRIYTKNAQYQQFEVLKANRNKRYKYNQFLVEGVRSLNEAVEKGWHIQSLLYGDGELSGWARDMLARVKTEVNYRLTGELMAALSGKTDTSELMAVIRMRKDDPEGVRLSDNPLIALFDRPSNKGNLGTMIRSCDALGVELLLLTGHAVDLYDPDVVASAMGSFFAMPVIRMPDNDTLLAYIGGLRAKYPGLQLIGTTAHRQHPIEAVDLCKPTLLMIGNETMGLSQAFKDMCDLLATIPMADGAYASSFNVSCAASIMMYEATRQRRAKAE